MLVDLRSAVQKAFDESSDILLISWKAEDGEELYDSLINLSMRMHESSRHCTEL